MRLFAIACLATVAAPTIAAPRVVMPTDLGAARPAPPRVEGLAPGATVTLTTIRRSSEAGKVVAATARFRADTQGRVDPARQAPLDGSYTGVQPLGLFWSATPRPAETELPLAGTLRLDVREGDRTVASATARTRPDPATLATRTDTPFSGAVLVTPAKPGRYPVIIVLGGSEGGSSTGKALAPRFAAQGYAALALPYYNPGWDPTDVTPGLPTSFTDIPVERLIAVRDWLRAQPGIDADRIGIWGGSKGAEYALIAASRYPWIRAVAAIVPSDLVWEGWGRPGAPTASFALDGRPLAFQPYAGMAAELAKAGRGEAMDLRRVHLAGRAEHPGRVAAARIPIERYRGALLVAGGGRDMVWPSAEMTQNIAATRRGAGLRTVTLVFPEAGHGLTGPGTDPAQPFAGGGGAVPAIADARARTWAATLDLFDRALKP